MRKLCFSVLLIARLWSGADALPPEKVTATREDIQGWLIAGAAYAISRLDPTGPGGKAALQHVEATLEESRTDELVAAAVALRSARANAVLQEHFTDYADQLRRGEVSRSGPYPLSEAAAAYLLWLEKTQPQEVPSLRPGLMVLKGASCLRLRKIANRLAP